MTDPATMAELLAQSHAAGRAEGIEEAADVCVYLEDINAVRTLLDQEPGRRTGGTPTDRERSDALGSAIEYALALDTDGLTWLRRWQEGDAEAMAELEAYCADPVALKQRG